MANTNSQTDIDVVIIGAGISGINAAYRMQTQASTFSYTILEGRNGMGGTWDFFKYPGIRSDSDLWTFGFPWRPWTEQKAIADGASIKKYIEETAAMYGIDRKIQYRHKVENSEWSTDQQRWRLSLDVDGEKKVMHAKFVLFATGYYDYQNPLPTKIAGIENFEGKIIHPQFWPEDLNYENKNMVIIGSGATAITLLPVLAEKASKVTMLQRSPGYILALPNSGDSWIRRWLPLWMTTKINRIINLTLPFLFYQWCRAFPNAARATIKKRTTALLPKNVPHDPHFEPTYNPWEQRMCFCPDGDFYTALNEGKADIATGKIASMTPKTVIMESGQEIPADILVTATGLKIMIGGGSKISVDGETLRPGDKFMWKGVMLQDLPNAAFVVGYTNASWTLGADATAQMVTRLLNNMKKQGVTSFVPRKETEAEKEQQGKPMLDLTSTYIQAGLGELPKSSAEKGQWMARSWYFKDMWEAKMGDVTTGLQVYRVST